MSDKLVKEIITTTTEKFNDNGSVKERVVESREKVYQHDFSEKEIQEAEVIEEQVKDEPQSEPDMTQAIAEAAKAIDSQQIHPQVQQQQNPFAPTQVNVDPSKYIRVGTPQPIQQNGVKSVQFPWEQQ